WRLGYAFGPEDYIAKINNAANVIYVCPATPLQSALATVLMSDPDYYDNLKTSFDTKRRFVTDALKNLGFEIFDSGSAFYIWARIPEP
ncbi:aminotransferase class I/II-fold pyridoxal phosphate-dependent enzyme, partial [Escherichia coli]|nr:aminotransferase class I/II-fold pyridoxal phosphate-dependent enzyme [Escherichia coli]